MKNSNIYLSFKFVQNLNIYLYHSYEPLQKIPQTVAEFSSGNKILCAEYFYIFKKIWEMYSFAAKIGTRGYIVHRGTRWNNITMH